jgi:membrane associated rhomboid family serine protease
MARSTPTTLALPPFYGATKRLILIFVSIFFIDAILGRVLPAGLYLSLLDHLALRPIRVVFGEIWQLGTYAFLPMGILGTLFAMLTIWFIGSLLEDTRGSRWIYELFFTSAIGGALLATLFSFTHLLGMRPTSIAAGQSAGIFGLLVAVAVLMGDTEFFLMFLIRIQAKYLVAIYVLVDIATLLKEDNAFGALLSLSGGLCAYLYLKFAPRRGLAFGVTERFYALRNDYYRNKRRRAAKKFEVYMGKQGREVHFDKEGRYIDPDQSPKRNGKDDSRWVN